MLGAWTAYTQNASAPPSQPLSVKQLAGDLYLIEGTSSGASDAGNIAVYITSEGIILVDDRFEHVNSAFLCSRVPPRPAAAK